LSPINALLINRQKGRLAASPFVRERGWVRDSFSPDDALNVEPLTLILSPSTKGEAMIFRPEVAITEHYRDGLDHPRKSSALCVHLDYSARVV